MFDEQPQERSDFVTPGKRIERPDNFTCVPTEPEMASRLMTNRLMLRSRDAMDREYDQPLDIAHLSRIACCSPSHFAREFKAIRRNPTPLSAAPPCRAGDVSAAHDRA